jgi:chromosome partitioning protein
MPIDPKITAAEVAEFLDLTVQAVHKRIKTFGLKENKGQNRIFFGHDTARKIINPQVKQLKIATSVVKGGVGKTTIAEALAIKTCLYGLRVLCVDVDQQANLTKGLAMDIQAKDCPVMIDLVERRASVEEAILNVIPGLDLLPSRLDNVTLDGYMMVQRINPETIFNKILSPIYQNYDLIIFDCPPTLGSTVCAAILASDLVLAPINPDVYSYEGIEIMDKEIQNIKAQFQKEIKWMILPNKFDARLLLSNNYLKDLIQDDHKFSKRLLRNCVIRTSQEFSNMKKKEKTIYDTLKKTTAKEDIDALAKEVIQMMVIPQEKITKQRPIQPEIVGSLALTE